MSATSPSQPSGERAYGWLKAVACQGRVRVSFLQTTPFFQQAPGEGDEHGGIEIRWLALPGFKFGQHYDEYFDGLPSEAAEVVFRGSLAAVNGRKYELVDETVKIGMTYAYWVAHEQMPLPTGPAWVRVRDPRVWWTGEQISGTLTALSRSAPGLTSLLEVGHTVHGRPLTALIAGRRDRALVLVGSVHGGEAGAELALPICEAIIADHPALLKRVGLAVLPCLNADQRERLALGYPPYLRTNASGVDLNRNFPADWEQVDYTYGLVTTDPESATYRGPAPASEPETQAVQALLRAVKPAAVLAFHHLSSLTGSSFLYAKAAAGDEAYEQRCREINRVYRAAMGVAEVGEEPLRVAAACTAGSLPAWVYACYGVPAFDLEGDGSGPCQRAITDEASLADLQQCQAAHRRAVVALLEALAGD